jgi:hypothetical protein
MENIYFFVCKSSYLHLFTFLGTFFAFNAYNTIYLLFRPSKSLQESGDIFTSSTPHLCLLPKPK